MSKNTSTANDLLFGIDVSMLPASVREEIEQAAKAAAQRAVQRKTAKAQANLDELRKWEGIANAFRASLTDDQAEAICGEHGGSIRFWMSTNDAGDVVVDSWKVYHTRSGDAKSNGRSGTTVWVAQPDGSYVQFKSGRQACDYLGLAVNGNSAVRVLQKNDVDFVKVKPDAPITVHSA